MTTETKTKNKPDEKVATKKNEVAQMVEARIPYHNDVTDRFDVDRAGWRVLVEAIFPNAKTYDAVTMALSYCQHRNLDIFKRPVHIVPMWSSAANGGQGGMIETVWPSIAELRTTASRTRNYAGCDDVAFGPEVTEEFKGRIKKGGNWEDIAATVTYHEWAQMTLYRVVGGVRCAFVGPKVYWKEEYATINNFCDVPNSMWQQRPNGQHEKCAEAAALRRAFPEEVGNDYAAEEMEGRTISDITAYAREVPNTSQESSGGMPPDPDQTEQTKPQAETKPLEGEIIPPEKKPEPPKAETKTFGKKEKPKTTGTTVVDGPPPVTQPELFRKWVAERVAKVEDGEALQRLWDVTIDPNEGEIFPPDYAELQGIFNKRGKELAP